MDPDFNHRTKLKMTLALLFFVLSVVTTSGMELVEENCPCIPRENCPRVWSSENPLDRELLGVWSGCLEDGMVRCCGVSVRVEQSFQSHNPHFQLNHPPHPMHPPHPHMDVQHMHHHRPVYTAPFHPNHHLQGSYPPSEVREGQEDAPTMPEVLTFPAHPEEEDVAPPPPREILSFTETLLPLVSHPALSLGEGGDLDTAESNFKPNRARPKSNSTSDTEEVATTTFATPTTTEEDAPPLAESDPPIPPLMPKIRPFKPKSSSSSKSLDRGAKKSSNLSKRMRGTAEDGGKRVVRQTEAPTNFRQRLRPTKGPDGVSPSEVQEDLTPSQAPPPTVIRRPINRRPTITAPTTIAPTTTATPEGPDAVVVVESPARPNIRRRPLKNLMMTTTTTAPSTAEEEEEETPEAPSSLSTTQMSLAHEEEPSKTQEIPSSTTTTATTEEPSTSGRPLRVTALDRAAKKSSNLSKRMRGTAEDGSKRVVRQTEAPTTAMKRLRLMKTPEEGSPSDDETVAQAPMVLRRPNHRRPTTTASPEGQDAVALVASPPRPNIRRRPLKKLMITTTTTTEAPRTTTQAPVASTEEEEEEEDTPEVPSTSSTTQMTLAPEEEPSTTQETPSSTTTTTTTTTQEPSTSGRPTIVKLMKKPESEDKIPTLPRYKSHHIPNRGGMPPSSIPEPQFQVPVHRQSQPQHRRPFIHSDYTSIRRHEFTFPSHGSRFSVPQFFNQDQEAAPSSLREVQVYPDFHHSEDGYHMDHMEMGETRQVTPVIVEAPPEMMMRKQDDVDMMVEESKKVENKLSNFKFPPYPGPPEGEEAPAALQEDEKTTTLKPKRRTSTTTTEGTTTTKPKSKGRPKVTTTEAPVTTTERPSSSTSAPVSLVEVVEEEVEEIPEPKATPTTEATTTPFSRVQLRSKSKKKAPASDDESETSSTASGSNRFSMQDLQKKRRKLAQRQKEEKEKAKDLEVEEREEAPSAPRRRLRPNPTPATTEATRMTEEEVPLVPQKPKDDLYYEIPVLSAGTPDKEEEDTSARPRPVLRKQKPRPSKEEEVEEIEESVRPTRRPVVIRRRPKTTTTTEAPAPEEAEEEVTTTTPAPRPLLKRVKQQKVEESSEESDEEEELTTRPPAKLTPIFYEFGDSNLLKGKKKSKSPRVEEDDEDVTRAPSLIKTTKSSRRPIYIKRTTTTEAPMEEEVTSRRSRPSKAPPAMVYVEEEEEEEDTTRRPKITTPSTAFNYYEPVQSVTTSRSPSLHISNSKSSSSKDGGRFKLDTVKFDAVAEAAAGPTPSSSWDMTFEPVTPKLQKNKKPQFVFVQDEDDVAPKKKNKKVAQGSSWDEPLTTTPTPMTHWEASSKRPKAVKPKPMVDDGFWPPRRAQEEEEGIKSVSDDDEGYYVMAQAPKTKKSKSKTQEVVPQSQFDWSSKPSKSSSSSPQKELPDFKFEWGTEVDKKPKKSKDNKGTQQFDWNQPSKQTTTNIDWNKPASSDDGFWPPKQQKVKTPQTTSGDTPQYFLVMDDDDSSPKTKNINKDKAVQFDWNSGSKQQPIPQSAFDWNAPSPTNKPQTFEWNKPATPTVDWNKPPSSDDGFWPPKVQKTKGSSSSSKEPKVIYVMDSNDAANLNIPQASQKPVAVEWKYTPPASATPASIPYNNPAIHTFPKQEWSSSQSAQHLRTPAGVTTTQQQQWNSQPSNNNWAEQQVNNWAKTPTVNNNNWAQQQQKTVAVVNNNDWASPKTPAIAAPSNNKDWVQAQKEQGMWFPDDVKDGGGANKVNNWAVQPSQAPAVKWAENNNNNWASKAPVTNWNDNNNNNWASQQTKAVTNTNNWASQQTKAATNTNNWAVQPTQAPASHWDTNWAVQPTVPDVNWAVQQQVKVPDVNWAATQAPATVALFDWNQGQWLPEGGNKQAVISTENNWASKPAATVDWVQEQKSQGMWFPDNNNVNNVVNNAQTHHVPVVNNDAHTVAAKQHSGQYFPELHGDGSVNNAPKQWNNNVPQPQQQLVQPRPDWLVSGSAPVPAFAPSPNNGGGTRRGRSLSLEKEEESAFTPPAKVDVGGFFPMVNYSEKDPGPMPPNSSFTTSVSLSLSLSSESQGPPSISAIQESNNNAPLPNSTSTTTTVVEEKASTTLPSSTTTTKPLEEGNAKVEEESIKT